MSNTLIWVENLTEKYIVQHQQAQKPTALRDVITDGAKSVGRRFSGVKQDPLVEFPEICPFYVDQVLIPDFWPEF